MSVMQLAESVFVQIGEGTRLALIQAGSELPACASVQVLWTTNPASNNQLEIRSDEDRRLFALVSFKARKAILQPSILEIVVTVDDGGRFWSSAVSTANGEVAETLCTTLECVTRSEKILPTMVRDEPNAEPHAKPNAGFSRSWKWASGEGHPSQQRPPTFSKAHVLKTIPVQSEQFAFVSHSSRDASAAQALVVRLESGGMKCWIAPRDVRSGADFRAEIVGAIERCQFVVALISVEANASQHVLRELGLADKHGKRIKPVRMDKSPLRPELDYLLHGLQWLDFDEGFGFSESLREPSS